MSVLKGGVIFPGRETVKMKHFPKHSPAIHCHCVFLRESELSRCNCCPSRHITPSWDALHKQLEGKGFPESSKFIALSLRFPAKKKQPKNQTKQNQWLCWTSRLFSMRAETGEGAQT